MIVPRKLIFLFFTSGNNLTSVKYRVDLFGMSRDTSVERGISRKITLFRAAVNWIGASRGSSESERVKGEKKEGRRRKKHRRR